MWSDGAGKKDRGTTGVPRKPRGLHPEKALVYDGLIQGFGGRALAGPAPVRQATRERSAITRKGTGLSRGARDDSGKIPHLLQTRCGTLVLSWHIAPARFVPGLILRLVQGDIRGRILEKSAVKFSRTGT